MNSESITRVLGAEHGIKGVLNDRLFDMGKEDREELELLRYTPSSALGSCRYKLKDPADDDTDYKRILEIFKKYDVRYFFYNGGNDSMDTCNKISKYLLANDYECRVIGIPKTIDNDLAGTDHCPGYGSAAKFIATATMEIYYDARVYDTGMVTVLEIMGRNAGWLAAASALAKNAGAGPDLIYLPEVAFDLDKALADIDRIYKQTGKCIIAVSEGIKDADGKFIAEYAVGSREKDSFGHVQMGGLAATLSSIIKERLGVSKVRGIEFSLTQRCAAHCASKTDIDEAYCAGRTAVLSAVSGMTDKMIAFKRVMNDGRYSCEMELVDLTVAANAEKKVPREWINEQGNGVNSQFIEYALPLIKGESDLPMEKGLPRFAKLKKILAEQE